MCIFCIGYFVPSLAQTNIPPRIEADGNIEYCPLGSIAIVDNFDIIDPDDTEIAALHIQIAQGYQRGQDVLTLMGNHPNIVDSWNVIEGKLSLRGIGGANVNYADLIAAVYDVRFANSSIDVSPRKELSFTIGDANYLPSTGHYYRFISDLGITWSEARVAAEGTTYFGLRGYLATITTPEEAQLSGEQAPGTGWIGGSDAAVEGVWRWMTGPEAGTVFWNGGMNGSSPNYSNWNTQEPNNLGDEDYAHVTAPNIGIEGSWNDLPNTGSLDPTSSYHPQGYIVEYGGMPDDPVVDISASTSISVPKLQSTSGNSRCGPGNITLEATTSFGEVLWYDVVTGGIPIGSGGQFETPIISQNTTYYALASVNGCTEGERIPVEAVVHEIPPIVTNFVFSNCDVDGVPDGHTDYNLEEANDIITNGNSQGFTITYHLSSPEADSASGAINPVPFNSATSSTVFARVESPEGCYAISTIDLQVSTTSPPSGFVYPLDACDDDLEIDGRRAFDLTLAYQPILEEFPTGQNLSIRYYRTLLDAQLEQDEIGNPSNYVNETPFFQEIYVRVEDENNGACFGIGTYVNLVVYPRPVFEVDTMATLCTDGNPIELAIYNPDGVYTYEWIDATGVVVSNLPNATIDAVGDYQVIATSEHQCSSFPASVTVIGSSAAVVRNEDIHIEDFSSNNTVTIDNANNNLGLGDYEFALDNRLGPYQDEPYFDLVSAGMHTLYVRDKNGCGISEKVISVLGYPKFFTPNNDGHNDTWNLIGWSNGFMESTAIYIYDRYGKLLKQLSPDSSGWQGTLNGTDLPASDYWFVVDLIRPDGTSKLYRGHFSLLR